MNTAAWKKCWRVLKPTPLESVILVLIAGVTGYWLDIQGWSWQAIMLTPAMMVFGYMSGGMLHDLWMPRRER